MINKVIATIADNYGLSCLHKEYSISEQFYFDKDEVSIMNSDYNGFYFKPSIPKIIFEKDRLIFPSEIQSEENNKNSIFHYNICNYNDQNVNVIMIHGWRSAKLNRLENVFLDSFIEKKYNMYSYILPFHMEREPESSLYSGEYFYSANINRTLKSVQQSICDIRALISHIKQNDNSKVVVIGLSLGGLISNLICEVEKDIDVLISLFYANDLSFTTFETVAGKYVKEEFIQNNIDIDTLRQSWSIINPSLKTPRINNDNILLVSGKYDKYVLNEDTDRLWESWNRPKRIIYNCGHSGIVLLKNRIHDDIMKFINDRMEK